MILKSNILINVSDRVGKRAQMETFLFSNDFFVQNYKYYLKKVLILKPLKAKPSSPYMPSRQGSLAHFSVLSLRLLPEETGRRLSITL